MTDPHAAYLTAGHSIETAEESQFFGKPCFKIGGKAFVAFFQDAMVFKLTGKAHAQALALPGALLFDPSGKGRAMREWVQLPVQHAADWDIMAASACAYVKSLA